MFLLRAATRADLAAILDLAGYLDSPNLPREEAFIKTRLTRSEQSFGRAGPPSAEREYQFALVDDADRVVGTCVILSKHGTRRMPHVYLTVREEERYSPATDIAVRHVMLQLGATWDGPTELGALVLHPDCRGQPGQPGKLLSWGRFAYIARHPASFEAELLAEMRAAIDERGRNAFWEVFGRRFTGMSYAEADRLSASDKSFILDLFPRREFYASLLDEEVSEQLGQVHPETVPALRLLERAGLYPIGQIDPFDAGPFVGAQTADVIPIRETCRAESSSDEPDPGATASIVGTETGGRFRAAVAAADSSEGKLRVAKEARDRLEILPGDEVSATPLPPSRRARRADG